MRRKEEGLRFQGVFLGTRVGEDVEVERVGRVGLYFLWGRGGRVVYSAREREDG